MQFFLVLGFPMHCILFVNIVLGFCHPKGQFLKNQRKAAEITSSTRSTSSSPEFISMDSVEDDVERVDEVIFAAFRFLTTSPSF